MLDVPDSTWERVFAINLFGPLRLTRRSRRDARQRHQRRLGLRPAAQQRARPPARATMAPYGVSKGALWTLTRYLAAELAPNIRVNALCPGLTSEGGGMRNEEPYERLLRSGAVPMMRIARPEEIAGAAVYLASPAASYTTGENPDCQRRARLLTERRSHAVRRHHPHAEAGQLRRLPA